MSNVWLACLLKNRYLLVFNVIRTKIIRKLFHSDIVLALIDAFNSGKVLNRYYQSSVLVCVVEAY